MHTATTSRDPFWGGPDPVPPLVPVLEAAIEQAAAAALRTHREASRANFAIERLGDNWSLVLRSNEDRFFTRVHGSFAGQSEAADMYRALRDALSARGRKAGRVRPFNEAWTWGIPCVTPWGERYVVTDFILRSVGEARRALDKFISFALGAPLIPPDRPIHPHAPEGPARWRAVS